MHRALKQEKTENLTFDDVKVFAGDNFYPAADASYKNLIWENLPVPDVMFHIFTPPLVSLDRLKITLSLVSLRE